MENSRVMEVILVIIGALLRIEGYNWSIYFGEYVVKFLNILIEIVGNLK